MGTDDIDLEALRAEFLKIGEEWMQPPDQNEKKLLFQISRLKMQTVQVAPEEQIAYMRMPPRQCHANCEWYAEQPNPMHEIGVLRGWRLENDVYILHSVVTVDGQPLCITPAEIYEPTMLFAADKKIRRKAGDDSLYHYFRGSIPIGKGVRRDPEKTIELTKKIRARLLSGMHPVEAMNIDPEE